MSKSYKILKFLGAGSVIHALADNQDFRSRLVNLPTEVLLTIAEAVAEDDKNSLMALPGFPAVLQHSEPTIVSPRASIWTIDSIACAPFRPSNHGQEAEFRACNVPRPYTHFQ